MDQLPSRDAPFDMATLPTKAYTVIVVTWRDPECTSARMFTLSSGGGWASADGVAFEGLDISDFKIVSEPSEDAYKTGYAEGQAAAEARYQLLAAGANESAVDALYPQGREVLTPGEVSAVLMWYRESGRTSSHLAQRLAQAIGQQVR